MFCLSRSGLIFRDVLILRGGLIIKSGLILSVGLYSRVDLIICSGWVKTGRTMPFGVLKTLIWYQLPSEELRHVRMCS